MAQKETFTDKSLKAMKPAAAGKRYEVWDTIVPNFGVRVTANGTKTFFVLKRTTQASQLLRHTIGKYPFVKLIDARAEARRIIEGVLNGDIVPKAEVRRRNETKRFDTVAESFIAEYLDKNTRTPEGARIVRR
ncbi:MAG: Arm DNA-binding domain-containing protein, partial [Rhizomicrobium sp.]